MGGYCQNHANSNIIFLTGGCHFLFLEHDLSCIFIQVVINFVFNKIVDEVAINDGTGFVCFSTNFVVTIFISYFTRLCRNSIHNYLLFVLKFIVWVFWIPMFLRMFRFIALTTYHIYSLSFASLLLLSWWFKQFLVFIGISYTFFTSDYSFLVFGQGVPFHSRCGHLEIWL